MMLDDIRQQLAAIRKALPEGSDVGLDVEFSVHGDGTEEVSWCCNITVPGQRMVVGIAPEMKDAITEALYKRFEQMNAQGERPLDVVVAKLNVYLRKQPISLERISLN